MNIPMTMFERALWARKEFIKNPTESQYDDNALIWCFNKEDGLWYSLLGNYSSSSPAEKRKYQKEWEAKVEDAAKKMYDDVYFQGKIRKEVLDRDEWTCQICGNKLNTKLHIHHILKRTEGGGDTLDNLITVCSHCHKSADTKLYNP
jgi:5-methylcytosine-specific restriction endonuclease McrA